MIERASRLIKPILGLDDDLVEALLDRPHFLLLGERAKVPLRAPVAPRAADPRIQNAPAVEPHIVAQAADEIHELRLAFGECNFVRDLEGNGNDGAAIVGQRRIREQDEMRAPVQPPHDLGSGLLARKLTEELFDVLNLERALLELVLRDVILHSLKTVIVHGDRR